MMPIVKEIIEALKAGEKVTQKMCPVCGNPLKAVIFGYLTNEMGDFIDKNHKYLIEGGCMCFMDDRDPVFECTNVMDNLLRTLNRLN